MSHRDRRNLWKQFIKGRLDFIDVPGGHSEFMHEPHVEALAKELSRVLDRTQPETQSSVAETAPETEPAAASAAD